LPAPLAIPTALSVLQAPPVLTGSRLLFPSFGLRRYFMAGGFSSDQTTLEPLRYSSSAVAASARSLRARHTVHAARFAVCGCLYVNGPGRSAPKNKELPPCRSLMNSESGDCGWPLWRSGL